MKRRPDYHLLDTEGRGGKTMDRKEALRRLKNTTAFTFVGGRVLMRDARILTAVAELRAQDDNAGMASDARAQGALVPRTSGVMPS